MVDRVEDGIMSWNSFDNESGADLVVLNMRPPNDVTADIAVRWANLGNTSPGGPGVPVFIDGTGPRAVADCSDGTIEFNLQRKADLRLDLDRFQKTSAHEMAHHFWMRHAGRHDAWGTEPPVMVAGSDESFAVKADDFGQLIYRGLSSTLNGNSGFEHDDPEFGWAAHAGGQMSFVSPGVFGSSKAMKWESDSANRFVRTRVRVADVLSVDDPNDVGFATVDAFFHVRGESFNGQAIVQTAVRPYEYPDGSDSRYTHLLKNVEPSGAISGLGPADPWMIEKSWKNNPGGNWGQGVTVDPITLACQDPIPPPGSGCDALPQNWEIELRLGKTGESGAVLFDTARLRMT